MTSSVQLFISYATPRCKVCVSQHLQIRSPELKVSVTKSWRDMYFLTWTNQSNQAYYIIYGKLLLMTMGDLFPDGKYIV